MALPHRLGVLADIAREIAPRGLGLGEEGADGHVSAAGRVFAVRDQGLEAAGANLGRGFSGRGVCLTFVAVVVVGVIVGFAAACDHVLADSPRHAIALLSGVEQHAHGSFAVPARAPSFLVVALETLGDTPVRHKTHVLLVDAHPERRGGDDDIVPWYIGDPFLLARGAVSGRQPSVVRGCADVVGAKAGG